MFKEIDEWSDETKRCYLACALDSEGWIGLGYTKRKESGDKRVRAFIGVTNQNIKYLERILTICDMPYKISLNADIGTDNRKVNTTKKCYQVQWNAVNDVIKILELALPYLVIKRQQALNVLEFCKGRTNIHIKGMLGNKPYTPRDFELAEQTKALNSRKILI